MSSLKPKDRFKVSVIVPVYNSAEYLSECFDSLVGQSIGLDAIQIVVVNDGSTDGSAEIIESYAKRYPTNFLSLEQENGGQGVARNLAIPNCEGEYVGFMDSDDFADTDMYKALYEEARKTDADICVCGIRRFCDRDGKREFFSGTQLPASPITKESLFVRPQTEPPIRIVRRSILIENGVRFPETRGNEDNGFHFKLAPFCDSIASVPAPMVNYRMRRGSTSVSISRDFCEQFFLVMDDSLEFYEEHGLSVRYGELLEATLVRMLLCSRLGAIALLEDASDRVALMEETVTYIETHFPDRRSNRYLTGPLGVYLRHAGRKTIGLTKGFFAFYTYKRKHHLNARD